MVASAVAIEQIECLLKDYRWMWKEIDRLEIRLSGYATVSKSWGVAQYGIEATLPHGSSGKSQAELKDIDIRETRQYERLEKLKNRIYVLEVAVDYIEDEKMKAVYDCLLDGMTYRKIGYHVGMSKNAVWDLKNEIIRSLAENESFMALLSKGQ